MANVNLKAYKVSEIVFNNKVTGAVQLKLGNKISHNVRYSKANTCEATLALTVLDKDNPDVLNIKLVVNGIFEILSNVEKEFIHVETFKELFPLAKAIVTSVTANAGIPPIMVKNVDIEKQSIYRFDMNGLKDDRESE